MNKITNYVWVKTAQYISHQTKKMNDDPYFSFMHCKVILVGYNIA